MGTSSDAATHVHCKDGSVMTFTEHPSVLYVYIGKNAASIVIM